MAERHAGSCLCGLVRFEIAGTFEHFFLCHCSRCRKDTGSAHAANLFASEARLSWLTGLEQVRTYAVPGTRHRKCFCSACGSALPYLQLDGLELDGRLLVVPAGSLDSAPGMRPEAHIHVTSRAGWDHALEQIPHFDTLPD
ncbi:GFA family protein [Marinibaculum pumilum]|uniref:GFA family protein n=1 Tax=Marinibaculum pumilum TaxID=1766165 RepID=A0ABV7L547_9PROT